MMKRFSLKHSTSLNQKEIFHISTDIKNFSLVMPDYFKSLVILDERKNFKIVQEQISFLGISLSIKTKHIIISPDIHEIYILSGPLKGTIFIEKYVPIDSGTMITIDIELRFSGFLKLFSFFENYVAKKMSNVMKEFIVSAEKFHSSRASYS